MLGGSREGVIGANLDQSRFWLRRAKNWTEFVQITSRILTAINNASDGAGGDERLSVFARYVDDLEPVARPYDLSFDAPWEESGKIPTQSEIDAFDWLSQHVVFIEPEDEQSARVRVTDGSAECTMVLKPEQRKEVGDDPRRPRHRKHRDFNQILRGARGSHTNALLRIGALRKQARNRR